MKGNQFASLWNLRHMLLMILIHVKTLIVMKSSRPNTTMTRQGWEKIHFGRSPMMIKSIVTPDNRWAEGWWTNEIVNFANFSRLSLSEPAAKVLTAPLQTRRFVERKRFFVAAAVSFCQFNLYSRDARLEFNQPAAAPCTRPLFLPSLNQIRAQSDYK